MAVTSLGSVVLNPYPSLLSPMDPLARSASLNPLTAAPTPGEVVTAGRGGGMGSPTTALDTLATASRQAGAGVSANLPTYETSQAPLPSAAPFQAAMTSTGATAQVGIAATTTAATNATTTTTTATTAADPLPGMLQVAYRAPLVTSLFPLAGLQGELPPGGPAPLDIAATNAVSPLSSQPGRQTFNPNLLPRQAAAVEAVASYRAQASVAVGGPPAIPTEGMGSPARSSLNIVG